MSINTKFQKWKQDCVTVRGCKTNPSEANGVFGSLGTGLYTCPLSNIAMAKTYGSLYFVTYAKPQFAKVFQGLNDWEIWRYNALYSQFGDANRFYEVTTIKQQMIAMGFDGVIIQGREMVNFLPKDELIQYVPVYPKKEGIETLLEIYGRRKGNNEW